MVQNLPRVPSIIILVKCDSCSLLTDIASPLDWLAVLGAGAGQLLHQAQSEASGGSIAGY